MKRILSILIAGLFTLGAVSCIQEQLTVLDLSNATAPVIENVEYGEKAITISFTPAVFHVGFNEKMPVQYSVILTSINDAPTNIKVPATIKDNVATISVASLSKLLLANGLTEGQTASLQFALRALMQGASADVSGGALDAEKAISIASYEVVVPASNPWVGFDETSAWSLIGAIESVGMNWDSDIVMYSNGSQHVARAVKLTTSDQFKFRKDKAWGENFGAEGNDEPFVVSLDTAYPAAAGGKNLGVPADGVYDLLLDTDAKTFTISEAYITYPGYDEKSAWSVIGAIASFEMNWDKDIAMITDGEWHVAEGVTLTTSDQFKFRKDQAWGDNFGAEGNDEPFVVTLDTEYPAAAGGKNLGVPADGIYDLLVNPEAKLFKVVETLGGKSSLIGGDEPEEPEEPEAVTGWNVIGANGDWDNDIIATEADGVWTAYFTAKEATEFKWRKDGAWDADYGIAKESTYTPGTPFDAVAGGSNIKVEAGFWKTVLDLSDEAKPTITVSEGNVWSLIGDFNGWGGDVDMVETESGVWVSPATALNNKGFKIRKNHDWATSYGGEFKALGEAFEATTTENNNIMLDADGNYVVTFDTNKMTITVEGAAPANLWSVIGNVNGSSWDKDFYMTEVVPGIWVSSILDITGSWKIRFNNDWPVNRGAAVKEGAGSLTDVGVYVAAYPDGEDLTLTGKLSVVYNANNGTIGTLGWSVIGKVASIEGFEWNKDLPMNVAPDGKWYSVPVALDEGDEIKVRWQASWDQSYGGTTGDAVAKDTAIDATTDEGKNLKAAEKGTYMVVLDPTENKVTLSTDFWGLMGDFNEWSGDRFMLPAGDGKWFAYNQELSGGWKIRKGADWTLSAGGTYAAAGEAFDAVTEDGPNIKVEDLDRFDILYDTVAGKITVSAPVK